MLRYIKIYSLNLHINEVKLIGIKMEIFWTFEKTKFCQNIRLIELRYIKVLLYILFLLSLYIPLHI